MSATTRRCDCCTPKSEQRSRADETWEDSHVRDPSRHFVSFPMLNSIELLLDDISIPTLVIPMVLSSIL